jgi:hypothetical protein
MPIDACCHNFLELAQETLPGFMADLRVALNTPISMSTFCSHRMGVKSILRQLGFHEDFSGCYVLIQDDKPFYVGISRTVVQRLRQHVTGETHFNASLAYKMATNKTGHEMKRAEAMADAAFRLEFDLAREMLQNCSVSFIRIGNPLELYLFEAYCAMELNTCEWNTFKTH